jgi:chromate transporter
MKPESASELEIKFPTFREALGFWFRLGFISFGGPAGQIAIMHQYLVEKNKWISESRFLNALNYCMLLPGPEAQQLATYTGWLMHGRWGGFVAGTLFVLPSMFILLALSLLYVTYGQIMWVASMFDGLKPAVTAIVILALIKIAQKSLKSVLHIFIALLSFVAIYFLKVPFPLIIGGAILTGLVLSLINSLNFATDSNVIEAKHRDDSDENIYAIAENYRPKHTLFDGKKIIGLLLSGITLWAVPFILLVFFTSGSDFWKDLIFFFTKAAFVTFGGAYAVLPYVAQVSVENLHWLSKAEMIDGLALGETTPGPLIMVLVFVGFMGGFHVSGGSLLWGTSALIITTYYTFLPSFIMIFTGAPFIERSREIPRISKILAVVTASVVGVILNLAVFFTGAVIFLEGTTLNVASLTWAVISFIALRFTRISIVFWIMISALAGLIRYFVLN